jgi:hypothetical protein
MSYISTVRTVGAGYISDVKGDRLRTIKSSSEQVEVLSVLVVDEERDDEVKDLGGRVEVLRAPLGSSDLA